MTIYNWKEHEQKARTTFDEQKAKATKHDPAESVFPLDKAREKFDRLAELVDFDLFEVGDAPSFSQDTHKQLLELCKLAHSYQYALDDEPDMNVDIEDGGETRIEKLAKFLRYAFGWEMWEKADIETIAVYRVEIEEMIEKREEKHIEGQLSRLEDALRAPDCTKEKLMAITRMGCLLRVSMEMDKSYFERFADIMEHAKAGNFVPMGREEIPLELDGGDEEWTEESMLKWFTAWQVNAKALVQVKEKCDHAPS